MTIPARHELQSMRQSAARIKCLDDIDIQGIDHRDSPHYVDAFISSATFDGVPLTDQELEELNEDLDFVHTQVFKKLY